MDNIAGRPFLMQLAPNSWLGEMLAQWLEWAPGDGRGSVGFATKEVLRVALLKANLGQLAQQFQWIIVIVIQSFIHYLII